MSYCTSKEVNMDAATAQYLQATISAWLPTDTGKVIVTGHYKRVFETIKEGKYIQSKGILISGPPGTGKSTTCVYLYEVLKENSIPFVIFPTASLHPENKSVLQHYLREVIQGNYFTASACSFCYSWLYVPCIDRETRAMYALKTHEN